MTAAFWVVSLSKQQLREQCKKRRNELTSEHVKSNSVKLSDHLSQHLNTLPASTIAIYFSFANEISIDSILIDSAHHRYVAPVVKPGAELEWREVDHQLTHNEFGIREPAGNLVAANEIRLFLMPLVGFDLNGNRIGMGAGYYDRALQGISKDCQKIGCAHGIQQCVNITADPWDIPLDAIATEDGIIWLSS